MLLSSAQNAELDRLVGLLRDYASDAGYAGAAWLNPHLISRFVADNPAGLADASLERVGLWRHAVAGPFYVMRHTETCSMFMNRLGTFAVRGTHAELRQLVPKTPTQVEVTLLPFEGLIVCAEDPVFDIEQLGEASRSGIDETYRSLPDKGVIYSAAALVRAARGDGRARRATPAARKRGMAEASSGQPAIDANGRGGGRGDEGADALAGWARQAAGAVRLAGPQLESAIAASRVAPPEREAMDAGDPPVPQGLAQIIAFKPRTSDVALS